MTFFKLINFATSAKNGWPAIYDDPFTLRERVSVEQKEVEGKTRSL